MQDLNFKVNDEFHRAYKLIATLKGMAMKELLEMSFYEWTKRHGDPQIRSLVERLRKSQPSAQ